MAQARIQHFDGYAPDRFARLEAALHAKGLDLSGNHGEETAKATDVAYDYDPSTGRLTLTLKKAPWLMSFSSFCNKICSFVESQQ